MSKTLNVFCLLFITLRYRDVILKTKRKRVNLRTAEFLGQQPASNIDHIIVEAIFAYEEALEYKNQKKTRAALTWRSVSNNGLIGAIEKAVLKPSSTQGFKYLADLGMLDLSFEQVVLAHKAYFSKEAVLAATQKLSEHAAL